MILLRRRRGLSLVASAMSGLHQAGGTPFNVYGFPSLPFPNHLSGKSHPQSYDYPGAVQKISSSAPSILSYTNALPSTPFPNHISGQSHPQSYNYPGAVQPIA